MCFALSAATDVGFTMGLTRRLFVGWRGCVLLASAACSVSACVQGQRASDTGDPGFPFGPSAVGTGTIAYVQDIKPSAQRTIRCIQNANGDVTKLERCH